MKKIPRLGEQEMELFRYVSDHSPVSVRDVATHFEQERKLARTTVLTVMERLRKKGFLLRSKSNDGIFEYAVKIQTTEIMKSKIFDFIEGTLGGSVNPLFNYFLSASDLTADEVQQLKELAAKLDRKKEL